VDHAIGIWHFPVYTIGPDENVRNYQGSALLLRQRLNLREGEKKCWGIEFKLGKIGC
jgi:hypothetical protein